MTVHAVAARHLRGMSAQDILEEFPDLDLGRIHAALAYYFANKAQVEADLEAARRMGEELAAKYPHGGAIPGQGVPTCNGEAGGAVEDTPIPGYRFLVTNPDRLGGKATIAGTRFSVSFILACLAEEMAYEDIVREYSDFPRESIAEVLRFAAEVTDRHDVAA